MPVSWQIGPSSSAAISILEKMMFSAWDACVSGVSARPAALIAARTSGGRFVAVWVISSTRLVFRNSMRSDILPGRALSLSYAHSGQQTRRRFGEIGQDEIRAGAPDRRESLDHGPLEVNPAVGGGSHDH